MLLSTAKDRGGETRGMVDVIRIFSKEESPSFNIDIYLDHE